ncbi:polymer-forming cytoskeletal protein [Parapedobacter sp. ISTM3]|uniref:bactofilin family protein n=1 Tax=Parapedobacter sp. ISTM3 TaxID=2800130 RepID=UPI001908161E|nr:polymer-forming cytoskeletal protein [Parapedobacter sp. ISTM3]MBK1440185.1 polymer-forming cytoskeletal protein [Parapedobacter sp. ISTM3]
MFVNKKNEKPQEQRGSTFNLISSGTSITGDINTSGDLRIDGQIIGDVTCTAKLVIGENGDIKGNVNCNSGEISGTVQGEVVAKEVLQLNHSASIHGDIKATRFIVEDGASINGKCTTSKNLSLPDHLPEVKLIGYEKAQVVPQ